MVGNESLLNTGLISPNPGKVQLPTGDFAMITKSGNCQLEGGDVVHNVLCVPDFHFNLLSVSKLTRELNCCASFFPDFFVLQDLFTGKVKGIGSEQNGLYTMRSPILLFWLWQIVEKRGSFGIREWGMCPWLLLEN